MIQGGYYLKARKTKKSAIAKAPPHVREIWDYLMREAFYKDGRELKRGQLLKSYQDIIDDLSWYVGWRKCSYKKSHCEISMKWLKKATMITTKKTTRGLIITILNFDLYQTPENYESHTETYKKATRKPQTSDTIDKEGYKKDKRKNNYTTEFLSFWSAYPKKKSKGQAWKTWKKLNGQRPTISILIEKIEALKNSEDWKKDGGQFIPHPSTWLNAAGWEDEVGSVEQGDLMYNPANRQL